MDELLSRRWAPWAAGVLMALSICAGYFLMPVFRGVWQSHYPSLSAQWANDGRFSLLGWFGTELGYEELWFAARVNEAHLGRPGREPFVRESPSRRKLFIDVVAFSAMGAVRRLAGSMNGAWLGMRFLCCIFWVVLLFRLCRQAGQAPAPALFCAAFVTGFSYILTFLFLENMHWQASLRAWGHNAWSVLTYGRTESVFRLPRPGVAYAFLFLAATTLIRAADGGWRRVLLGGVLGGALAYVHFDVWSTYIVACWAFAAAVWWKEGRLPRSLLWTAAVATVVSLPFVYYNHSPSPELVMRAMGATPGPAALLYIVIFLAGLRWGRTRAELFFSCAALATCVMVNHGLVLGYQLEYHHWMYIGNIFVFLLAVSLLGASRGGRARPGPWLLAAGVLASAAFLQGVCYAAIHFPFQGLPKDYDGALDWLQSHTRRDDVVLSLNPEVNSLIPAFTPDKVFFPSGMPTVSDYPLLASTERLLAALDFIGADRERFLREVLFAPPLHTRRGILDTGLKRGELEKTEFYKFLYFTTPAPYAHSLVSRAAAAAGAPRACPRDWLDRLESPVSAPDYIWVGSLEREYAGRCFSAGLTPSREVYRNPSVTIYRYSGR